ncbi:MAG: peptide chain release factor 2 [Coriobacteriales bacterium]|nr:peptide chain release factor 2 [Coriobacteriales bacterium]
MEDLSQQIGQLQARLGEAEHYLHLADKRANLEELEGAFAKPGFWDDQQQAARLTKQAADIRADIEAYEGAAVLLEDAKAADELARLEDDEGLFEEAADILSKLECRIDELELASWFTGELDSGDAIISVNPGQGGLEAQDWADMLFRMYMRYAQRHSWKVEVLDAPAGEVIGIDHATFIVSGHNAYGMLAAEQGVHRLVRISPTDEKKRRQTTFAGVEVLPVLPDDIEIEINAADLRIDVYRSSGPGGQSVNTTDSAVRITHLPTNTVVTCQNEKSQLQNKEAAMKILRARLYEMEQARREAELEELRGPRHEASWGNQIRNYVLYPYQMVKDVRTGVETGNVDAVLDGDLDQFIVAFLRMKAAGNPQ